MQFTWFFALFTIATSVVALPAADYVKQVNALTHGLDNVLTPLTSFHQSPSLDKLQAAENAAADLITAIQNSTKELQDWPAFTESESNKNVDASTKLEAKAEQVVTKIVDCKNDFVHLNVLKNVITLFEQLGQVTVDWEDAFILRAYPAHVPTCKNLRAKIDAKFKDADHRLKE